MTTAPPTTPHYTTVGPTTVPPTTLCPLGCEDLSGFAKIVDGGKFNA